MAAKPIVCYRCRKPVEHNRCGCADGIALIHGDCRTVLPELEAVDLVLVDPPYGIGEARGRNKTRTNLATARDYGSADWDDSPLDDSTMAVIRRAGKKAIVWGGNYYALPPSRGWLVWDKDNGANDFADCELAWTNLDTAVRKFHYRWNGMFQEHGGNKKEDRVHPTQKPLALMAWCIKLAKRADTILDGCCGSGTTLVAAKALGRRAIGIELEEKWVKCAAERLRQGVLSWEESVNG